VGLAVVTCHVEPTSPLDKVIAPWCKKVVLIADFLKQRGGGGLHLCRHLARFEKNLRLVLLTASVIGSSSSVHHSFYCLPALS
jgi:hypothetical protein